MSFDGPDVEYVDGELVERNRGEKPHSFVQARLIEWFYELRKRLPVYAHPELRLRLAPRHYRIPDVSVFSPGEPGENVPGTPPLAVIEIVSSDDRHTDVAARLEEYWKWGVKHVRLIDPWARRLSVFDEPGLRNVTRLTLPELDFVITPADVFER